MFTSIIKLAVVSFKSSSQQSDIKILFRFNIATKNSSQSFQMQKFCNDEKIFHLLASVWCFINKAYGATESRSRRIISRNCWADRCRRKQEQQQWFFITTSWNCLLQTKWEKIHKIFKSRSICCRALIMKGAKNCAWWNIVWCRWYMHRSMEEEYSTSVIDTTIQLTLKETEFEIFSKGARINWKSFSMLSEKKGNEKWKVFNRFLFLFNAYDENKEKVSKIFFIAIKCWKLFRRIMRFSILEHRCKTILIFTRNACAWNLSNYFAWSIVHIFTPALQLCRFNFQMKN